VRLQLLLPGKIAPCEKVAGDTYCSDKGDSIWVVSEMFSRVSHEDSDGIVTAEVSRDLLVDEFWRLRTQHLSRSSLVGH
jgi:hypothetical protein